MSWEYVFYDHPNFYRLLKMLQVWSAELGIPLRWNVTSLLLASGIALSQVCVVLWFQRSSPGWDDVPWHTPMVRANMPHFLSRNWWRYITSHAEQDAEGQGSHEDLLLRRWGVLCSRSFRVCLGTRAWPSRSSELHGETGHQKRLGPDGFSYVQLHHPIEDLQLPEAFYQGAVGKWACYLDWTEIFLDCTAMCSSWKGVFNACDLKWFDILLAKVNVSHASHPVAPWTGHHRGPSLPDLL